MGKKERADVYLVKEGFFASRERAKAAILEGKVFVSGQRLEKAGTLVDSLNHLVIRPEFPYVSRGGLKLEKALKIFGVDVRGKVVLDAGAGVGGFTDYLIKAGAAKVIAVDVGYGDFAFSLRQNPKVFLLERTNFRYLTPDKIPEVPQLITVDLSFISVKKVTETLKNLLEPEGGALILVKPQFEAPREDVGRKGVVRDEEVHKEVLQELWQYCEQQEFEIKGMTFSPILGREGNMEFWMHLKKNSPRSTPKAQIQKIVEKVVSDAHRELLVTP